MQFAQGVFALLLVLGHIAHAGRTAQPRFGAQSAEVRQSPAAMAGAVAGSGPSRGPCAVVSPPGDGPFPLGADRPRLHPERAAARAKCRSPNTARWRRGWWRAALRCWCRSARAMARPAANISRTRAAATTPTIRRAGHATADAIAAALHFLRGATFHPAGRHGRDRALRRRLGRAGAGDADNPQDVAPIIAFAPGRGGRANDFPNQVCAPHTLISAAAEFGTTRGCR